MDKGVARNFYNGEINLIIKNYNFAKSLIDTSVFFIVPIESCYVKEIPNVIFSLLRDRVSCLETTCPFDDQVAVLKTLKEHLDRIISTRRYSVESDKFLASYLEHCYYSLPC